VPDLVGRAEIAARLGTSVGMVDVWRRRHADFPAPLVKLASGPVWEWLSVVQWTHKSRPIGRPKRP
jgi:hypothetical protein